MTMVPILYYHARSQSCAPVFLKQLSREEWKLLLSAVPDVISSSDRSASWPVTAATAAAADAAAAAVLGFTQRWSWEDKLVSQWRGDMMPGKLGCVWKRFLNWLCGKIRKKKAWKLLILDLWRPAPPNQPQLQAWELTSIKTSENAWRANRNCFSRASFKLLSFGSDLRDLPLRFEWGSPNLCWQIGNAWTSPKFPPHGQICLAPQWYMCKSSYFISPWFAG